MSIGLVAVHYPDPERFDEFVLSVQRVADVMRTTPGCRTAQCWLTSAGDAVVSIAG